MSGENKALVFGTFLGTVIIAIGYLVFPYFEPNSPNQLVRTLILQASVGILRVIILAWSLWFVDAVTEGRWAKTVAENPYAAGAVYLGIIYAVSSGMRVL